MSCDPDVSDFLFFVLALTFGMSTMCFAGTESTESAETIVGTDVGAKGADNASDLRFLRGTGAADGLSLSSKEKLGNSLEGMWDGTGAAGAAGERDERCPPEPLEPESVERSRASIWSAGGL